MTVLAAVDDLFFAARIREAARQTGVSVEIVPAARVEEAVAQRQASGGVASVIVDLNSTKAVDLIRSLKTNTRTTSLPILGFVSHVASDLISAARTAGCDQIMARSAFTKQLPELLLRLDAGPQGPEEAVTHGA